MQAQVDSLDPWGVSLSMWAYGVLGRQAEPVLTALCRRGAAVMRGFTPVDCAAALAGWARLRARAARHREFLDALMAHALDALSGAPRDWEPRELAQSAWGLSRVGVGGRHRRLLLETLMDVVQRRLEQFGPRDLSTVVFAYARLRFNAPGALLRIQDRVLRSIDTAAPLDMALLLWGFARLGFAPREELMRRLGASVVRQLGAFKPRETSILLYSYGALSHNDPLVIEAVAAAAAARLDRFGTQELVAAIWALGALRGAGGAAAATLLPGACAVLLARARARRLAPGHVAVGLKGLARAGFRPPAALTSELCACALENLASFKPVELCHLMWALARLGARHVELVEAAVARAAAQLQAVPGAAFDQHTPGQRAFVKLSLDTVVWAAQRLGYFPAELIEAAGARGVRVKVWRRFKTRFDLGAAPGDLPEEEVRGAAPGDGAGAGAVAWEEIVRPGMDLPDDFPSPERRAASPRAA
ncbi:hypothetical protein MNEG_0422 [Monoraphidium neglectum]|uniref:RNA-editing substrate-binding complex 6 protein domain-containing protein n=1 Tax=Monoraphidium neglectum TaxID=145388 RepID=A0A0D2KBF9_9CHLO|nr:hypothetical protein MNEG_0422 [Monoraphidium neglectum]KIZ07533.1 hypothetical protein MNEG_0422 [Monoraphidium neglectum]|eukprot:XP_013906552.1 hypothetical protein MNEG_0422 [Monoraphidium neglectum]